MKKKKKINSPLLKTILLLNIAIFKTILLLAID